MAPRIRLIRSALWALLLPASLAWSFVTFLRRRFPRTPYQSSIPVICVGNLHAGGSGKTPIVMAICRRFETRRPAVVTRGYGGSVSATGGRVGPEVDALARYGDEACLLASELGVPVYVDRRRARAVRAIERETDRGLVVMDDGFQHFGLARRADLVVINSDRDLASLFALPLGDLREPISALRRCTAILLVRGTGIGDSDRAAVWRERVAGVAPGKPVFEAERRARIVVDADGAPVERPGDEACAVFAGLGHPESFVRDVGRIAPWPVIGLFPDHHRYTPADLGRLAGAALSRGARRLLTTEKDFIKIKALGTAPLPVWRLRVEYEFAPDFWYFLENEAIDA